ncbi:MAG: C39 family peptidase [Oscillospiraceae bacterium]|nr:C39 family peptidase [Oscillospiraceae bacterium]
MKTKKRYNLILILFAAVLAAFLLYKPAYNLYRDISFSWEERSTEAQEVKAFAESRGISIGEYPWEIIELYENNPETKDFVLNYPFREEMTIDLSGYDRGTVPLFLQWDPLWGYEPYGSSCIAVTGCGPTCLAMAGYYLTGDTSFSPAEMAAFAQKNGYYETGYGSSWTLISEGAGKLGLTATELPLVKKKMTDALEAGSPVILALGKGDFTTTGHYIVLTGWTGEAFTVNDPNSRIRSQRLWTYEELEGQIRNIWAISPVRS